MRVGGPGGRGVWGAFQMVQPHRGNRVPPKIATGGYNMKMVKSLLLGSAAGLVAVAGAQAADLPVKAKPVEYVKVCSLYGAGFFYIPGTDTCIKIGGWVRAEYTLQTGTSDQPFHGGAPGRNTRIDSDEYRIRARWMTSLDVRTQTEY